MGRRSRVRAGLSPIVPDASLVPAALFPSQLIPPAREILLDIEFELLAPAVLRQEFTNAVWHLERRRVMIGSEADTALAEFERLPILFMNADSWVPRALAMARRYDQPRIFDAIYLACAEDLGVDLWTCDRRFVQSFGADRPPRLKLCPDDLA